MKKVVTIIAFILIIFCISKVQAFSDGTELARTEEKLEDLIETRITTDEENWKFINTEKYTADNAIIYKIGNEDASKNKIYLQYLSYDNKIRRVIKHGYKEKEPSDYGLNNEDDLYLATKIALDCLENNKNKEDIDEFYRVGSLLNGDLKTRAENVIKAAKEILDIGINGETTYAQSIGWGPIGDIQKDNIKDGYYSQLYKVDIEGNGCKGYKIEEIGKNSLEYLIANADTSETQTEFTINENQFKILIPEEYGHDYFNIEFKLTANFLGENFYIGTDWSNKYLIYMEEEEERVLQTKLYNRNSTLAINVIDEETLENIYGVTVEINGETSFIDTYQKIVKTGIPKSTVHIKVTSIPKEYEIESAEYDIDMLYNEDRIETIKLKHKKGKVEITTKVGEGVYEIYDLDSNKIVPHIVQDDGNIYVADINIGKYKLKQISVNSEYELANDINFEIKHNETTKIAVENTLKEEIKEDRVDPKDENDIDKEGEENHEKEKPNETEKEQDNGTNIPKEEEKDFQGNLEDNLPKDDQNNENPKNTEENKKQEEQEKEEDKKQEQDEKKPNLGETTQDNIEEPKEDKTEEPKEEGKEAEDQDEKEKGEELEDEQNALNNEIDKEDDEQNKQADTLKEDSEDDTDEKEEQEQHDKINKNSLNENMETLPRTGDDYFLVKLISINLILFIFFVFLLKLLNKKQTARII